MSSMGNCSVRVCVIWLILFMLVSNFILTKVSLPIMLVRTGLSVEDTAKMPVLTDLSVEDTPNMPVLTGLSEEEMERTKMRQRERKELMERVCSNIPKPKKDSNEWNNARDTIAGRFEVASEYSVMNCRVHKAGSTAWNAVLAHLYHKEQLKPFNK
ncbi:unnamed protein product, partial [Meganyctiphanes norvegica]